MPGQPEQHVNEGCCKFCGARLSLVKRMSRQEFCSNDHRDEYMRGHGDAALERLQETSRPKAPTSTGGVPGRGESDHPAAIRPTGSILGLSAPPPAPARSEAAQRLDPAQIRQAAAPPPLRPAPPPAAPAPQPVSQRPAAAPVTAAPEATAVSTPPVQTMALARTKARPKPAGRGGQLDPALGRLMEAAGSMQEAPAARAPMRFGPERFAPPAEPEPEFARPVSAASPPPPVPVPMPAVTGAGGPAQSAPPHVAPPPHVVPPPVAAAAPNVEPEEEPVTVERRGARPPATFVLTGQLAYGSRVPRQEANDEWEPMALTPTALPELKLEETETGALKIDGESVPGTVGQLRAVAGDLMTILVVRAAPSLLPGLMELPKGPVVEPNDWGAFRVWVRERIREQDGPDPAGEVELPEIEPRAMQGSFVHALFGADRFWPNPKTYIVYPTRELVRRPLLQHAELPTTQETVPLLVNRQYEAAHRRIMAEWSPAEGESAIPAAGAIPPAVAPRAGTADLHNATTQPTSMQSLSVLPQSGLAPSSSPATTSGAPYPASGQVSKPDAPTLPSPPRQVGERVAATGAQQTGAPTGASHTAYVPGRGGAMSEPSAGAYAGGFGGGIVLPRFSLMTPSAESRPLVVLHRQPPVAKMVTLDLEPADRAAGPAPAPPMVAADIQPEIRQTPSGRPVGRLDASLRLQTMVGLTGNERDSNSPLRGDEESMVWNWLVSPALAVPPASLGVRRARVPVLRTAVRLAGADRGAELFLSPTPVDFTATVDQWSAL